MLLDLHMCCGTKHLHMCCETKRSGSMPLDLIKLWELGAAVLVPPNSFRSNNLSNLEST
jgi:hypothetical protein